MKYFETCPDDFDPVEFRKQELRMYMLQNEKSVIDLAESYVDYKVEIGEMAPVECLYDPLFEDIFDVIEKLGIREIVEATFLGMLEDRERAVQNRMHRLAKVFHDHRN